MAWGGGARVVGESGGGAGAFAWTLIILFFRGLLLSVLLNGLGLWDVDYSIV